MKILVVAKFFPTPAETFVLEQVNSLIELGHDVQVLVLYSSEMDCLDERSIRNGVPNRIIDGTAYAAAIKDRVGVTVRGAIRSAFKHPSALRVSRYGSASARGQVLSLIGSIGALGSYDLIYGVFGQAGMIAEIMRDIGLVDGPIVTNFLGYDITQVIREEGPAQYRRLFEFGALFLPNSNYLLSRLVDCGAPSEKVMLHRLGVNINQFSFIDRSGHTGAPHIVAVGRLVEKKGFAYLLQALSLMKQSGTEFQATIVGDGPLRDELKSLQRALGLEELVTFAGWCEPTGVQKHLEHSDINIVPSVIAKNGDEEGLPLTIVEASARGLPTVGTVHSGIPEIVRDGETGLVVEERNAEALAGAIKSLCLDSGRRIQMGKAARALVENEFNAEIQGQRLSKTLSDVAQGRF